MQPNMRGDLPIAHRHPNPLHDPATVHLRDALLVGCSVPSTSSRIPYREGVLADTPSSEAHQPRKIGVREETGLDVEVTGIVGIYSDPAHVIAYPAHVIAYTDGEVRQEFNICFAAKLLGGRLSKSEESTELRWVDPRTVGSLPMHESIRLRIKHFLENRPAPSSPDRAPRRTPTPANGKGTTDGSALLVNVG
jgi:hypothetical protein